MLRSVIFFYLVSITSVNKSDLHYVKRSGTTRRENTVCGVQIHGEYYWTDVCSFTGKFSLITESNLEKVLGRSDRPIFRFEDLF